MIPRYQPEAPARAASELVKDWSHPMRTLLALIILTLAAGPAFADEKPKANLLTPKEIANGWLLLFDGETTFGWKVDGEAKVKDGVLRVGGPDGGTITTTTRFARGLVKFRYTLEGNTNGRLTWRGGEQVLSATNSASTVEFEPGESGYSAIAINAPAGSVLAIEFIRFQPTELKPLFNGKNLDGWKVFAGDPKRMATKFDVTQDGELSAKNGPGDLQTEGQYDNFVLQLECKTNGKGLNSGLFFRCIADQYQNGYEAQIQNSYIGDDRTKPVDYGTGAIYRRVATRKVVSNDNEWFTMTVVADGPHLATWVNGYQTADWTDERKPNDNPRNGLRTAKGHLSIQGHDPTTDLLFRNIRIAELPGK
jgi:hypothetical protein